jgi:GGDEF domain-containing protein
VLGSGKAQPIGSSPLDQNPWQTAVIEKFPQLAAHPVLTFSVGAAKVVPGLTLMQALKRGEEALSAAKIAGRNRLCWAP